MDCQPTDSIDFCDHENLNFDAETTRTNAPILREVNDLGSAAALDNQLSYEEFKLLGESELRQYFDSIYRAPHFAGDHSKVSTSQVSFLVYSIKAKSVLATVIEKEEECVKAQGDFASYCSN